MKFAIMNKCVYKIPCEWNKCYVAESSRALDIVFYVGTSHRKMDTQTPPFYIKKRTTTEYQIICFDIVKRKWLSCKQINIVLGCRLSGMRFYTLYLEILKRFLFGFARDYCLPFGQYTYCYQKTLYLWMTQIYSMKLMHFFWDTQ